MGNLGSPTSLPFVAEKKSRLGGGREEGVVRDESERGEDGAEVEEANHVFFIEMRAHGGLRGVMVAVK